MSDTPVLGIPQWEQAQASPWTPHNEGLRVLEGFALRTSVADRDLTAPPVSCADGARYFVAAVATGAWASHDGQVAISFGTNASNGWYFAAVAREGAQIWVEDEATQIEYVNGSWVVSPERITGLDGLSDVDLAGLNDGDILYWDSSNSQFYPAPAPAGGGASALSGLSDVDLSGGIPDGYVLKYDLSQGKWFPSEDLSGSGGGAADGNSAWSLVGTGQTATGVYDQAVDGSKVNIDFINLSAYNEIIVIARGLTCGTSSARQLLASVDNGSTFYTASGDYISIDGAGVETAQPKFAGHSTASTAARSFIAHILNLKGVVKECQCQFTGTNQFLFVASTSDINALRINSGGVNPITAGTVRVYGR